jgi:hypothetical protein
MHQLHATSHGILQLYRVSESQSNRKPRFLGFKITRHYQKYDYRGKAEMVVSKVCPTCAAHRISYMKSVCTRVKRDILKLHFLPYCKSVSKRVLAITGQVRLKQ